MSLLDELLLGFDEALEWPIDDEDDPVAPDGGGSSWGPLAPSA
jgi:hypothetical protein